MTIKVIEQPGSRTGTGSGDLDSEQTRVWHSSGSDDLEAIIAQLKVEAPYSISCPVNDVTLVRNELTYEPAGFNRYELKLRYVDKVALDVRIAAAQETTDRQLDIGESRTSFSTTGGTARICTSLATLASYKRFDSAATIPNFKQAINVSGDNDVQGVDIVVPAMRWTYSYRQPHGIITQPYVQLLEIMTGTCNNATFKGRAAGEVLFMGCNGSQGTVSDPTIDYEFLRLPNMQNQTIGDIVGIAKRGHDYLWVLFEETVEDAAKTTTKVPKFVYVEQVYPYTDFAALGI